MPAVKLGSPLKRESIYKKIIKYINHKLYKFKLLSAYIIREFMLIEKLYQIISWLINIIITGALIYYIIDNDNFIAYGLIVIMSLYYLDVIVQIIKKPYDNQK